MATQERTKRNIIEWNPKYEVDFESEATIGKVKSYSVRCKDCSSVFRRTLSVLTDRTLIKNTCETCMGIKRVDTLDSKGFDFLGKIGKDYYVVCRRCNVCTIKPYCAMTSRTLVCDACKTKDATDKLANYGCEFIEMYSKDKVRWVVFKDADGITRDKRLASITSENFRGRTTSGKFHVYIFWNTIADKEVIPDGFYFKIGISKCPSERMEDLQLDYDFNIYNWMTCATRKEAYEEEKRLHKLFWWCKLDKTIPQIFTNKRRISTKNKDGKRSHAKDGVTEWFYLPEDIFNFMLRNKESFNEYHFAGCS